MYSKRYTPDYSTEVVTGGFRARFGRFLSGCAKQGSVVRYRVEDSRPTSRESILENEVYVTAKVKFSNNTTLDIDLEERGPCLLSIFSENYKEELPPGIVSLIDKEFPKENGKCYSIIPLAPE